MSDSVVVKEENTEDDEVIVIEPDDEDTNPEVAESKCGKVEVPEASYELDGAEVEEVDWQHNLQTEDTESSRKVSYPNLQAYRQIGVLCSGLTFPSLRFYRECVKTIITQDRANTSSAWCALPSRKPSCFRPTKRFISTWK